MNAPEFYTAFARLYDAVARAPGVGRVRDRFATALAPGRGSTVLDVGCGTGANHRPLRREIGPDGTYLGVDFSPGVLQIARRREAGPRTHFCRGDATRPPIRSAAATAESAESAVSAESIESVESAESIESADSAEAVCASFLVGMLTDPAAAVRTWARLVGPGGRIGLLNLSRTARSPWQPLNLLFRAFVRVGSPPSEGGGTDQSEPPVARLERRVEAAHAELERVCASESVHRDHRALGFAQSTVGTVQSEPKWAEK